MTINMRFYLDRMHQLDSNLCVAVNLTSQYRLIRDCFRVASRLGDGIFWYAIMLVLLAVYGREALLPVLHVGLTGLTGTLIYKWLKGKTLRPRPYEVIQDIWLTGKPLDKFSFPSGHTLHAVAFSVMLLAYFPLLAPIVLPFTILVALSRVVLGLHYPSDVIAGAAIGAGIASVSLLIFA